MGGHSGSVSARARREARNNCWRGFVKSQADQKPPYRVEEGTRDFWLYDRGFTAGWEQSRHHFAAKKAKKASRRFKIGDIVYVDNVKAEIIGYNSKSKNYLHGLLESKESCGLGHNDSCGVSKAAKIRAKRFPGLLWWGWGANMSKRRK